MGGTSSAVKSPTLKKGPLFPKSYLHHLNQPTMKIEANTVEQYLHAIPEERKPVFNRLRDTIIENIPDGFEEQLSYGMIGYVVPVQIYPSGYYVDPELPLPFCNIASQKNFIGFYHMGIYSLPKLHQWFVEEYAKASKYKLDMGKSCVRLKRMDDIPFELIGKLMKKVSVKEWVEVYESQIMKRKK
jgi:hypothetical protein